MAYLIFHEVRIFMRTRFVGEFLSLLPGHGCRFMTGRIFSQGILFKNPDQRTLVKSASPKENILS